MTETFNLDEIDVDSFLADLTIGEMEALEEITGAPLEDLVDEDGNLAVAVPKVKLLKAIVWISKHRENPDFTLEDASRLKLSFDAATITSLTKKRPRPTKAAG